MNVKLKPRNQLSDRINFDLLAALKDLHQYRMPTFIPNIELAVKFINEITIAVLQGCKGANFSKKHPDLHSRRAREKSYNKKRVNRRVNQT